MKRLIVGISGASGMPIALQLLKKLKECKDIESHVIYTHGAEITINQECKNGMELVREYGDVIYENHNIGEKTASGTFKTIGMVIVPCSMKTLAGIHSGYSDNLLLRSADVTMKENRKLVLVTRETPFNSIHLRNMYELSTMGVRILPPVLTYYNHPKTIADCTAHIVGKIFDQFDIDIEFSRWMGLS